MILRLRSQAPHPVGPIVFVLAFLAPPLTGATTASGPSAPAAAVEDRDEFARSLLTAVTRFEQLLRDRLATASVPGEAAAFPDADRLRRGLINLRREAHRLGGVEGGELERRLLALRPLLSDLERRGAASAGPDRSPVHRGQPGAAGASPFESGGGPTGIAGMLTLEATGEPIAFESVFAWTMNGFFAGSALTDASGHYQVTGLAAGTYFVNTALNSGSGLLDELYDDLPCPSASCDPTAGTPIVVQPGALTPGIDFVIGPGGTIAGEVTDAASGGPIGFAEVRVFDQSGSPLAVAFSDSSGHYQVSGLADGDVFARARHDEFSAELFDDLPCEPSCDPTTGTPIPVAVGTTTTGIDFDLDGHGAVAGQLTDTGGAPVPFEEVVVFNSEGEAIQFGCTDALGGYEIGGLPAGQYFVRTSAGGWVNEVYDDIPCYPTCDPRTGTPVSVTSDATTPGIDFELRRLGRITGRVVDSVTGSGVAGADVRAFDDSGTIVAILFTDGNGDYEIGSRPAGTYFVIAQTFNTHRGELYDDLPCSGGVPPGCDPTTGTPVAVQLDAVTADIDFALDPLGTIRGTVTESGTGVPLTFRQVKAWDAGGNLVAVEITTSNGKYDLPGLEPGVHFVTALSEEHVSELYDDLPCPGGPPAGCDPTTGIPIAIGIGSEVTGIGFALDPKGRIAGQVTEQGSGLPIGFADVAVWNSAGQVVTNAEADGSGLYLAEGLDTGTYFVTASTFQHAREVYDDIPCPFSPRPGCDPTIGTPVPVVLGATTPGIDFDLAVKGSVHGRVTEEETGQPLPKTPVWLFDEIGGFGGFQVAGEDGFYTFHAVEAGTHFVVATDISLDIGELYDDIPCPDFLCDPTTGTPVPVTDGVATTGIDFDLPSIVLLFTDGFESGDTSAWTTTVE